MKGQDWNPGHTVDGGYPFVKPVSQGTFPNRMTISMDLIEKQVYIDINKKIFTNAPEWPEKLSDLESFFMDRLYDYSQALSAAEGQIEDMLLEQPFVPEDLGFEIIAPSDHEMATAVFESKYQRGTIIMRSLYDSLDESLPLNMWTLIRTERDESGKIIMNKGIELNLPCKRIAYATFFALGIKMKEDKAEEPAQNNEANFYTVLFERVDVGKDHPWIKIEGIDAADEAEAIQKAMEWMKTNRPEHENLQESEFRVI